MIDRPYQLYQPHQLCSESHLSGRSVPIKAINKHRHMADFIRRDFRIDQ